MMQDDGLVGPHIDRQGRVDQSYCNGCILTSTMITGIMSLEQLWVPAI